MDPNKATRDDLLTVIRELNQRLLELDRSLNLSKAENVWLEASIRRRTHELNERVQELDCLYSLSRLLDTRAPGPKTLQGIVELIPRAFQRPALAGARLTVGDQVYKTPGYQETPWTIRRDFSGPRSPAGSVQVSYGRDPAPGAAAFLEEEYLLLGEIASRLLTSFSLGERA